MSPPTPHLSPIKFTFAVVISFTLQVFLFWIPIIGPFAASFIATFLTLNSRKQGFWASLLSTGIVGFGIAGILLYAALAIDKALWVVGAVVQSVFDISILQYSLFLGLLLILHTSVLGCLGGALAGYLKEKSHQKNL